MKKTIRIMLSLSMLLVWGALVSGGNNGSLEAKLNTNKQECRDLLKDTRYEGSKTTYFSVQEKKQVKSIEVFLFMSNEYVFAVGAKHCSAPLTVKIYDSSADAKKRILIKEMKNVNGSNLKFSSAELNAAYAKKMPKADKLKNLFVEYHIGSGETAAEGVVLVYGSK
jgi:hypothetical protein